MTNFFIALTVLMLLVLYFDLTRYLIPNWLVGMVLALYPAMVAMAPVPVDWKIAALLMLATFAVGYLIFAVGWMGGGDIKLLTACVLWTGLPALLDFFIIVSLLGGALSVLLIAARRAVEWRVPDAAHSLRVPRLFKAGQPAPYGVAIALGFLFLLWQQRLPGLTLGN